MEVLRTPGFRFADLPDFDFEPHYVEIPNGDGSTIRMHYIDEGPRAGRLLLCLHGEPTWSYLYRRMIPHFTQARYRSIAPDLIGFGRSDKPVRREDDTYARHVAWLDSFVATLDLRETVLICQDWGGLLGFRLVAERVDRFAAVVAANTFLPTGDEPPGEAFERWRAASQQMKDFDAGRIVARTCTPRATAEVAEAYNAPFPDETFKPAHGNFQCSFQPDRTTRRHRQIEPLGRPCANTVNRFSAPSAMGIRSRAVPNGLLKRTCQGPRPWHMSPSRARVTFYKKIIPMNSRRQL